MCLDNEGVIKSTFLIGSVEGEQLEEVWKAIKKLELISSLKEEKVWKNFSYKKRDTQQLNKKPHIVIL